jgi:hypothetical protein
VRQETLLVNSSQEATILEVQNKLEELANGLEDQPDPLGADNLPSVLTTGELDTL